MNQKTIFKDVFAHVLNIMITNFHDVLIITLGDINNSLSGYFLAA